MTDATERLVNLALYLATTRVPVSAEAVRANVAGYPAGQDEDAFLRMFERDKKLLRACGLALAVTDADGAPAYRLDAEGTYAAEISLAESERAALHAVAAALATDPGFPFGDDLAIAIAKLGGGAGEAAVTGGLADERPDVQGALAATLAEAVASRKRVAFGYTNAAGEGRSHETEPLGVFFRDGRWYLVARDIERDDIRVYALRRMEDVRVDRRRPGAPDFDPPEGFTVAGYMLLPFQYGPEAVDCVLRFSAEEAWRATRLIAGQGRLEADDDGSLLWHVEARDLGRLAAWMVEHGPGITPVAPDELRETLVRGLRKVVTRHGG
ncbi:MAG: YafY family protein [Coriobacteriia bacterium]